MSALEKIVVAHDGSDCAAQALAWARDLALQTGASVVVVRSFQPLDELGKHEPPVDFHTLHEEAVVKLRDEWAKPLVDAGVNHDVRVVDDLPVPGIVSVANEVDADLIVCGTRGMGGVKGLLLGSVAQGLAKGAHRPVAIIPPG